MNRVDLLRTSSLRAEAHHRQELSSMRALRQAESRERAQAAESRKEFWRQVTVVAETHGSTQGGRSPLSPAERMWRAHETLTEALTKHEEALGRLHAGGERLVLAQERIDLLHKMIAVKERQRACRLQNQSSDEMGDLMSSLVRDVRHAGKQSQLVVESAAPDVHSQSELLPGRVSAPECPLEQSIAPQSELKTIARCSGDSGITVKAVCIEDLGQQRSLTVECDLGAKGAVSVCLVKRDEGVIEAIVAPDGAQLAQSVMRDRAQVLARLHAIGVRVGSLSVGRDPSGAAHNGVSQRMRRRSSPEDDESRIA